MISSKLINIDNFYFIFYNFDFFIFYCIRKDLVENFISNFNKHSSFFEIHVTLLIFFLF